MDLRNNIQKFCLLEENFLNVRYRQTSPAPLFPTWAHLNMWIPDSGRLFFFLVLWFSVCTAPKHLWFRGVAMHTKNAPSDLLSMIHWCFELAVSSTMCCTKGFKVLKKCNWNKLLEVALANFSSTYLDRSVSPAKNTTWSKVRVQNSKIVHKKLRSPNRSLKS